MNNPEENRKKICWITPDYFLIVDANRVPYLIDEFEIEWILINSKNSKRKSDGLLSHPFKPKELNLKYRQKDPRIIWQYIKFLNSIQKLDSDLIYIAFHGFPFFFPLFLKLLNPNKVIWGVHNVSTPVGASNARWMGLYQNYIFKRIKNFHVFSRYQLEVINKKVPNKNHYYTPLPLENYGISTVLPPTDVIRFLFFGYIKEYKRLDLLINSFLELKISGIKNIELYIAGSCDNWDYYKSLITDNTGIKARIGMIPNKDIPDLVSSCHYMVLPYKDGAQSGVLNLAYQYNIPAIVSDIESFKQFIIDGETGYIFKNESQESLTNTMKKIIFEHDKKYIKLKQNIKLFVEEEYAEDKVLALYRNFLNECMKK